MLATVISAYVTERDEFQITRGYQPTNSLFYIQKGSFVCKIGEKEEILKPGNIAILDAGTFMTKHVLEHIRFLYIKYSTKSAPIFPIESGVFTSLPERVLDDLCRIEELSNLGTPIALKLQTHYFNDLILNLLQDSGKKASSKHAIIPTSLDRPIKYMREKLGKKISLSDVAKDCGMSVSSLESKFKELMGISAYNFLISLRIEQAKELLTETSYQITDIAESLGYDNLFYFCNAFKKQTGMTPSEFRKQNLI